MVVNRKICVGCGGCMGVCPVNAISFVDGKSHIDKAKCIMCHACMGVCPVEAITDEDDK